ncbi:MAG: response regulator [Chryseolinea sp.]
MWQFPFIKLDKTFNKPTEALPYLEKFPTDLLFLDINMPALSGIDFYKGLKQSTMVIFTTACSEYAVEGFNLSAVDYLLKPFTPERFEQAVQRAKEFYEYQHQKPPKRSLIFTYVRTIH